MSTEFSPVPESEKEKQTVIQLYRQMDNAVTTIFEQITREDILEDSLTTVEKAKEIKKMLKPTIEHIEKLYDEMIKVTNPSGQIEVGSYSNHDIVAPMRRAKQFFNFLDVLHIEDSDQEKRLEVWHRIEIIAYNLEKVLYVFQDLASRRLALDSVPKEFIDMDKKKSIGSVFSAVENLIAENRLKVDNYTIDIPAELRKLKIDVAHGVLFNKISNILSNVMSGRKDIQSKNIWFNAEISPDEKYLLVNIKDDGKGIPEENLAEPDNARSEPTNIFQEGFTTKTGRGLGLAFARKQIQSMGGDIIVVSQRVKDQSEQESGGEYAGNGNIHTTFTIKIPLYKEAA